MPTLTREGGRKTKERAIYRGGAQARGLAIGRQGGGRGMVRAMGGAG